MNERQKYEISENIKKIFDRDGWSCVVCGKPVNQIAHGLANSKMNIKKYSKEIVHHLFNLHSVCSLACNAKMNIDNKPFEINALLQAINESTSEIRL